MLVIKIDGRLHYINIEHIIEIYEEMHHSPLDSVDFLLIRIKLIDGSILTIKDKHEQDVLFDFLEGHFNGGEA